MTQIAAIREEGIVIQKSPATPSPHQTGLGVSLWGIFLIGDWYGGTQPIVSSASLNRESWFYLKRQAERAM